MGIGTTIATTATARPERWLQSGAAASAATPHDPRLVVHEGGLEKAANILVHEEGLQEVELEATQCEMFLSAISTRFMLTGHRSSTTQPHLFKLNLRPASGGLTACWPPSFCAPYKYAIKQATVGVPVATATKGGIAGVSRSPTEQKLKMLDPDRCIRMRRAAARAFRGSQEPLCVLETRARLNCSSAIPIRMLAEFNAVGDGPSEPAAIVELPLDVSEALLGRIEATHAILFICRPATNQDKLYMYVESKKAAPAPLRPVFGASTTPMTLVDVLERVRQDELCFNRAIAALAEERKLYTRTMRWASATPVVDTGLALRRRREEILGVSSIESEVVALFNKRTLGRVSK